MNAAIDIQSRKLDIDQAGSGGELLFERSTIKEALTEASREKVQKHLFAEYAQYREVFDKLKDGKAEYNAETLSKRLQCETAAAIQIGADLTELGFFTREGNGTSAIFWIPFIYRDGLEIKQGAAD